MRARWTSVASRTCSKPHHSAAAALANNHLTIWRQCAASQLDLRVSNIHAARKRESGCTNEKRRLSDAARCQAEKGLKWAFWMAEHVGRIWWSLTKKGD